MNKIYQLKFNRLRQQLIAVSELTTGGGKTVSQKHASTTPVTLLHQLCTKLTLLSASLLLSGLSSAICLAAELPAGGQILAGEGQISQSGKQMIISQNSKNMVASWQSFDIGKDHLVQFIQPDSSAIALNKVTGQSASQIMGTLQASGKVFLLNPNGVLVGKDAVVSSAGFLASSKDMLTGEFMQGNYRLSGGSAPGAQIISQGNLTTSQGGFIVLAADQVRNEGTMTTAGGNSVLAAADSVTLTLDNTGITAVTVNGSVINSLVENRGLISASGGRVYLTARGKDRLLQNVVNNSGVIDASSISARGGVIHLDGGAAGLVSQQGSLLASSTEQQGGRIVAEGQNIHLVRHSRSSASGKTAGGEVFIGGGWQGNDPLIANAAKLVMDDGAQIDVSATENGSGGKAVLWSEQYTSFNGQILATAGHAGGNGGQVETSSRGNLQAFGTVSSAAPQGNAGQWLLDPTNVTITDNDNNISPAADIINDMTFTPQSSEARVSANSIQTTLNLGGNVTIQTSGGADSGQSGDITVDTSISKTGGGDATLTLIANNNISFADNTTINSTSHLLNVHLQLFPPDDPRYGYELEVKKVITNGNNFTADLNGGSFEISFPDFRYINTSWNMTSGNINAGNILFHGNKANIDNSALTASNNLTFDLTDYHVGYYRQPAKDQTRINHSKLTTTHGNITFSGVTQLTDTEVNAGKDLLAEINTPREVLLEGKTLVNIPGLLEITGSTLQAKEKLNITINNNLYGSSKYSFYSDNSSFTAGEGTGNINITGYRGSYGDPSAFLTNTTFNSDILLNASTGGMHDDANVVLTGTISGGKITSTVTGAGENFEGRTPAIQLENNVILNNVELKGENKSKESRVHKIHGVDFLGNATLSGNTTVTGSSIIASGIMTHGGTLQLDGSSPVAIQGHSDKNYGVTLTANVSKGHIVGTSDISNNAFLGSNVGGAGIFVDNSYRPVTLTDTTLEGRSKSTGVFLNNVQDYSKETVYPLTLVNSTVKGYGEDTGIYVTDDLQGDNTSKITGTLNPKTVDNSDPLSGAFSYREVGVMLGGNVLGGSPGRNGEKMTITGITSLIETLFKDTDFYTGVEIETKGNTFFTNVSIKGVANSSVASSEGKGWTSFSGVSVNTHSVRSPTNPPVLTLKNTSITGSATYPGRDDRLASFGVNSYGTILNSDASSYITGTAIAGDGINLEQNTLTGVRLEGLSESGIGTVLSSRNILTGSSVLGQSTTGTGVLIDSVDNYYKLQGSADSTITGINTGNGGVGVELKHDITTVPIVPTPDSPGDQQKMKITGTAKGDGTGLLLSEDRRFRTITNIDLTGQANEIAKAAVVTYFYIFDNSTINRMLTPADPPPSPESSSEHPGDTTTDGEHPDSTPSDGGHAGDTASGDGHAGDTTTDGEHPDSTPSGGGHAGDTTTDGEHPDSTPSDGGHAGDTASGDGHAGDTTTDGEHPDSTPSGGGHAGDTASGDGHAGDTTTDGEHPDGTTTDGEHPDDTASDGGHPDSTPSDGEHPDDTASGGGHPDSSFSDNSTSGSDTSDGSVQGVIPGYLADASKTLLQISAYSQEISALFSGKQGNDYRFLIHQQLADKSDDNPQKWIEIQLCGEENNHCRSLYLNRQIPAWRTFTGEG